MISWRARSSSSSFSRVLGSEPRLVGTVVQRTKLSVCAHPAGEVIWEAAGSLGVFTGTNLGFAGRSCTRRQKHRAVFVVAGLMVLNGLANALGQFWWTRSLHLAPTSAVAPFNYFTLVWAIILGFLFWNDVPTTSLLIGSGIVVGSGFFLLWRESRPKQAAGP